MKRLLVALFPLVAACSSTSSSGTPDSGSTVPPSDGGVGHDAANNVTPDGGTAGDSGGKSDSGSVASGDAGGAAATACAAWASAFCAQVASCSAFGIGAAYGDTATCATRLSITCNANLAAPSTGATPASTSACAATIGATACSDFLVGNLGQACATAAGTIATSSACGFDSQCVAGDFCAIAPDSLCGKCEPKTTVNGACANGACSTGMACDTVASSPVCVGSNSVASGGACDVQQQCNLAAATGCSGTGGTAGKCDVTLSIAASGAACGVTNALGPDVSVCPASGFCSSKGLTTGTCSSAAADGASCSADGGVAGCMPPAVCVAGTCALPNAASCH